MIKFFEYLKKNKDFELLTRASSRGKNFPKYNNFVLIGEYKTSALGMFFEDVLTKL